MGKTLECMQAILSLQMLPARRAPLSDALEGGSEMSGRASSSIHSSGPISCGQTRLSVNSVFALVLRKVLELELYKFGPQAQN